MALISSQIAVKYKQKEKGPLQHPKQIRSSQSSQKIKATLDPRTHGVQLCSPCSAGAALPLAQTHCPPPCIWRYRSRLRVQTQHGNIPSSWLFFWQVIAPSWLFKEPDSVHTKVAGSLQRGTESGEGRGKGDHPCRPGTAVPRRVVYHSGLPLFCHPPAHLHPCVSAVLFLPA